MSDPRLLVGIPTLTGYVHHRTVGFVAEMASRGHGCLIVPGHSPREYAKNLLVHSFLDTDYDALLVVDADMVPTIEAFEALMEVWDRADAACGHALILHVGDGVLSLPVAAYLERDDDGGLVFAPYGLDDPAEAEAIGGAFTFYKRHLLSDRRLWLDEKGSVFRNRSDPSGRQHKSEDVVFSEAARAAGYRLFYVPRAEVGHLKEVNLDHIRNTVYRA